MNFLGYIQLQELVKHNKKSCDSWAIDASYSLSTGQTVKLSFVAPIRTACVTVQALLLFQKKIHHILYFPNLR